MPTRWIISREARLGGSGAAGSARSLWLREAMADGFELAPPLEGEGRADVCIVGGGYTGLWTALAVKETDPALDVVLLEADVCGGGASGRNGGFVLTWWSKFPTLKKLVGAAEALTLARASQEAVTAIGDACRRWGIDCGFRQDGWLWAATNRAQLGSWRSTLDEIERHGATPFREVGAEEAAALAGSATHLGGVFEPAAAIVQPARLAHGLRRVASEVGVRIHERSPVTALERGRPVGVQTAHGRVLAERVVLAEGAWGVRFRELRRMVLVVSSDIVATAAAPDRLAEIGWSAGPCVSDGRLLVHYYRSTADGRIAFGKGGGILGFGGRVGARFEGASRRRPEVEAAFRRTYPSLADVPVETSWTGPVDRSRSGLPFFGRFGGRPEVVVGIGYSGNGVGPSYVGGRILASMALGLDDDWSRCGLVDPVVAGFPPEPFRFVGGMGVRAAIRRMERAQDESRRPGPISRSLLRLAPAGLVPVKRE